MGRLSRTFFAFVAAAGVGGCANLSRDCDPTTGGFLGAVGCDAQGRYDQRIQQRESEASSLMVRKAALIEEQSQLEAQQRELARQTKDHQQALSRAQSDLAAVKKRLGAESAVNQDLEAKRRALEQEVSRSEESLAEAKAAESKRARELARLNGEMRALEQETEAALGR